MCQRTCLSKAVSGGLSCLFPAFRFPLFNTDFLRLISHHSSWFCEYFIIPPINAILLSWPELASTLYIPHPVSPTTPARSVGTVMQEEAYQKRQSAAAAALSPRAVLSHTLAPTGVMARLLDTTCQTRRSLWILCLRYRRKRHASLSLLTTLSRPIYTLPLVMDQLCPSKSIPTQLGKKIKITAMNEKHIAICSQVS